MRHMDHTHTRVSGKRPLNMSRVTQKRLLGGFFGQNVDFFYFLNVHYFEITCSL